MSRSPLEAAPSDADDTAAYLEGWNAINRLMRQGWSWSGRERNAAFLNLGGGHFADVSFVAGFDDDDDGRAAVRVDWDLDGDLDLFVSNRNGPRLRYFENRLDSGAAWVALRLRGRTANLDGVGARVEVQAETPDGRRVSFVHGVRAGEGYLAQSSAWVHAGLGEARPLRAVVRWPGGAAETFEGLAPRSFFVLEEGSGRATPFRPAAGRSLPASPPEPPPAKDAARVVLVRPLPMPVLELETDAGAEARLFDLRPDGSLATRGRPLLLVLWASWCAPCRGELRGLGEDAALLQDAGVDVLALSADDEEGRAAARAALLELSWPHSRGFAKEEAVGALEAVYDLVLGSERRLPLPVSLLVDPEGSLRVLYVGPVEAGRVTADLALLELDPEALRRAAVPFPGTFVRPAGGDDLERLEQVMIRRDVPAAARQYGLQRARVVRSSPPDLLVEFARQKIADGRLDAAAEDLRSALEADPDHLAALLELGRIESVQGDHESALLRLRRAVELAPENASAHHFLGFALASAGDLEGARAEVLVLERLEPERARSLAAYVESLQADGR